MYNGGGSILVIINHSIFIFRKKTCGKDS